MNNILVTGANGQLAQALRSLTMNSHHDNYVFTTREQLDLTKPDKIEEFFDQQHFDIVINCAAYTAVDKAETEPELADAINHCAVAHLAKKVKDQDGILIHLSTDYVFDGQSCRPYKETDAISPRSVYGSTKAMGEAAIQRTGTKGIIIRTSWIYSPYGNNFVKTMLRLGWQKAELHVVSDQTGTPTCAITLASAILQIIQHQKLSQYYGEIFHYSNEGTTSWYDFATCIMKNAGLPCTVLPIETVDYPTPATRPFFSVLNKRKIRQHFGLDITHWQDALNRFPFNPAAI